MGAKRNQLTHHSEHSMPSRRLFLAVPLSATIGIGGALLSAAPAQAAAPSVMACVNAVCTGISSCQYHPGYSCTITYYPATCLTVKCEKT